MKIKADPRKVELNESILGFLSQIVTQKLTEDTVAHRKFLLVPDINPKPVILKSSRSTAATDRQEVPSSMSSSL